MKENPLRREAYDRRYEMTLRNWLLHHQERIVLTQVTWMGLPAWKNPLDCWIYQEIIHAVKPDAIVEIGSRYGGSTQYFADLLELLGKGIVISIDIDRSFYQCRHNRVIALTGNSSDPDIVEAVRFHCQGKTVLVIQDGDHRKTQVLRDLENYSSLVTPGSYFIVEDGIVDLFHPDDGLGFDEEGPLAAVEEFLTQNGDFVVDESRERYLLTYNPRGFLKKIR